MSAKLRVLEIELESETQSLLKDALMHVEVISTPMDMDKSLDLISPPPNLILVGAPKNNISPIDLVKALRLNYEKTPIYICCNSRTGFERKQFKENGYNDAFILPLDSNVAKATVEEELSYASSGELKVYKPVKIIDVQPGDTLTFDTNVYLPANRKYVRISVAGDPIDASRLDKLKRGKTTNVYVPLYQMKYFYEYSAKRLKALNSEFTFSATERKEKLTAAVRELISGMFTEQSDFDSGQGMLNNCSEIVKNYIMQGAEGEWYLRILNVLGDRGTDTYSHTGNVSTLAALFSMGLGVGKPEELALAGLLHDIGIAELPPEIQELDPVQMTPEQLEEYKKHPVLSVNLIRNRKIVVSESVTKTILQHHELYNGQGYPNGLFGDRITKEAQVLALADRFDYLTALKDGKALMTPAQAVEQLREEQVNDPSRIHYNPELIKKLLALFPAN